MAVAEQEQVCLGDTLATLKAARQQLASWAARLEAYAEHGQPGQATDAARVAGIVEASIAAAACDTRAVAREARGQAADRGQMRGS